jgi:hypothetical protein
MVVAADHGPSVRATFGKLSRRFTGRLLSGVWKGLPPALRLLIRTSLVRDLLPWEALSGLINRSARKTRTGQAVDLCPRSH